MAEVNEPGGSITKPDRQDSEKAVDRRFDPPALKKLGRLTRVVKVSGTITIGGQVS